jgi:hypothetical protein
MGFISGILNLSSMDLNPMYLHHGDSPGSVLVTQLLTSDNYFTWSRSMYMALSVKKKTSVHQWHLAKTERFRCGFFIMDALKRHGFILDHQFSL